jgi:Zn finger protein HypA/HybF involved in hydrogenase expression
MPDAHATIRVNYAFTTILAAAAIDADESSRTLVDTATADELRLAVGALSGWLAAVIRHTSGRAGVTTFIDHARAEAAHLIDTAGRCDCDRCRRVSTALACTCPECKTKQKGH